MILHLTNFAKHYLLISQRYSHFDSETTQSCFAAEFNTIAIDDGIAMGHDGMLYSLPSRDLIADSVETMAMAHQLDLRVLADV